MINIKVCLQGNRSASIVFIALISCYKFKIQRGDIPLEEFFGSVMHQSYLTFKSE